MGVFAWLGGRDNPRDNKASADRARAHRRSIAKTEKAARKWDARDRRDHGDHHPFPRR